MPPDSRLDCNNLKTEKVEERDRNRDYIVSFICEVNVWGHPWNVHNSFAKQQLLNQTKSHFSSMMHPLKWKKKKKNTISKFPFFLGKILMNHEFYKWMKSKQNCDVFILIFLFRKNEKSNPRSNSIFIEQNIESKIQTKTEYWINCTKLLPHNTIMWSSNGYWSYHMI